jgi:hypothetical protein
MLGFLVDNIYVVFGDQVFQQSVGIPRSTNSVPLLADLFFQKLLQDNPPPKKKKKENKKLAVSFNHTFRYIDDVLSINNQDSSGYIPMNLK